MDCLKDELRPKEKVLEGKTRLFSSGDKTYMLLCKKYFGAFAEWIQSNHINNGISIGIDPIKEWGDLYKWCKSRGSSCHFGDYGSFDKTILDEFMEPTRRAFIRFYGSSDVVSNKIRDMLWLDMVDAYHLGSAENEFSFLVNFCYRWGSGNSSGVYLTGIINSFANESIITYVAAELYVGKKAIEMTLEEMINASDFVVKNIHPQTYGDDNIINFDKKIAPFFFFH